jgi:hypothetical protein
MPISATTGSAHPAFNLPDIHYPANLIVPDVYIKNINWPKIFADNEHSNY